MRRFLLFSLLLCCRIVAAQVPADDSNIFYEGRTVCGDDGSVRFNWSGTMVRIRFSGTSLAMNVTDTGENYFNVWVDSAPSTKADLVVGTGGPAKDAPQTVVLADKLKKGIHEVVLQKRSEGLDHIVTLHSFTTDGKILPAEDPFSRHIEFIGDSYTCGFGTEGADRSQPFRESEENCNLAYAEIIGRFFDAGVRLISHSGKGIVRNYNDETPGDTMVERYSLAFDQAGCTDSWDAAEDRFRPDIVVIYLGTNDFSCGIQPALEKWCKEYAKLLGKVRANYGKQVPVLCVASKASPLMSLYVQKAVEGSGVANVHWTDIHAMAHNSEGDLGSSWHPNHAGMRKVASCMIPYIATLTGWDLPVKPVE